MSKRKSLRRLNRLAEQGLPPARAATFVDRKKLARKRAARGKVRSEDIDREEPPHDHP